jgi:hypothetical protein
MPGNKCQPAAIAPASSYTVLLEVAPPQGAAGSVAVNLLYAALVLEWTGARQPAAAPVNVAGTTAWQCRCRWPSARSRSNCRNEPACCRVVRGGGARRLLLECDPPVNLFTMDGNRFGRVDSNAYLVSLHPQDGDGHVPANHQGLTDPSCQNEHSSSLSVISNGASPYPDANRWNRHAHLVLLYGTAFQLQDREYSLPARHVKSRVLPFTHSEAAPAGRGLLRSRCDLQVADSRTFRYHLHSRAFRKQYNASNTGTPPGLRHRQCYVRDAVAGRCRRRTKLDCDLCGETIGRRHRSLY